MRRIVLVALMGATVVVLPGDVPLLRSATLLALYHAHHDSGAAVTLLISLAAMALAVPLGLLLVPHADPDGGVDRVGRVQAQRGLAQERHRVAEAHDLAAADRLLIEIDPFAVLP